MSEKFHSNNVENPEAFERSKPSDAPVPMSKMAPRAKAHLRRVSAIPTLWNGVQFRSRLEARWAAFLTELRIPWAYEPRDLDFYIPDFILPFPKRPLLVEVKPTEEHIEYAKHKINHSGWEGDALIAIGGETREWGLFFETDCGWDASSLGFCLACKSPTIVSASGRWECRSCGADRRKLWWAFDCSEAWKAAGNATQWRSGT